MKVYVVLAIVLAICGVSLADEDKKTKVINFWKCLACHENKAARDEYMACREMKPKKCKEISTDCKHSIMPDVHDGESCWEAICKDEHNEAERFFDCIMSDPRRKDLSEEEETQMKEFKSCCKKVHNKYCDGH